MSDRHDRYWPARVARLERKLQDRDEEIALLRAQLRSFERALYTPETLAIIEAGRNEE